MTGIKPTAQLRPYGVIVPFFIAKIQSERLRPEVPAFLYRKRFERKDVKK